MMDTSATPSPPPYTNYHHHQDAQSINPALQYYADLSKSVNFTSLTDPRDKFDLIQVIGEGTYGEVFRAKEKGSGNVY